MLSTFLFLPQLVYLIHKTFSFIHKYFYLLQLMCSLLFRPYYNSDKWSQELTLCVDLDVIETYLLYQTYCIYFFNIAT